MLADQAQPLYADVLAAASRLKGVAHRTPVLTSPRIDTAFGASLFFKCENLQRAGAFKFRGAYNTLAQIAADRPGSHVVAYSSGNHAQAVALAAHLLGLRASIVMPHDAPVIKVAATAGYGAEVIRYDRYREDREQIGRALAARYQATLVPPFDHADVIAGQGTAALELIEEVGALDALLMPLGGGGLLAGSLLVMEARQPACRVYGVEPEAGDDGQQSLRAGRRIRIETPTTIADGAQTQQLGVLTFPIIQRAVADILAVSDAALVEGMRELAASLKVVVEPTGCLGFVGAQSVRQTLEGLRVGVILSGGNVDRR
jgi:threo-3-hydroxy-L-aspartate ammonia-lyase